MYGCPEEGMTYDSSVCGAASMAGIPVGTPFVLHFLEDGDGNDIHPVNACSANGYTTDEYRSGTALYHTVYRIETCAQGNFQSRPLISMIFLLHVRGLHSI